VRLDDEAFRALILLESSGLSRSEAIRIALIWAVERLDGPPAIARRAEIDASYAAYDEIPLDTPDAWGDLASWQDAAGKS